jgi:molybdopterin-guanine dinucleotide biosynthesis protein A
MQKIDGILLAGGQSSRMGKDKALLKRDHRSMLSYLLDMMEPLPLNSIYISRNKNQAPCLTHYPVVLDSFSMKGPLSGIYSIAKSNKSDGFLIVPIDMPLIETHDLKRLINIGHGYRKPTHFKNNFLPLYLPNLKNIREYLKQTMSDESKSRSIKQLCRTFNAIEVEPIDELRLSNTNTPNQWRDAEYLISII